MLISKLLLQINKINNKFFNNKLYIVNLKKTITLLNSIKNTKPATMSKLNLNPSGCDLLTQPDLISYIINIKFSETNTFVNITDINGNPRISLSSGRVSLTGKQKTHQPAALIKIFKIMFSKIKFLSTKPVALHFIKAKRFHLYLAINFLKHKVFIKTIRNYNLNPYNGCRPKKLKRLKRRKK